ncbi:hypothetical protein BSKO_14168 [Bryopsis sp. KO-2023]|nr:hypothetical protein BSKO_14168 [Bryopsis sp. KO-2023]
MINSKDFEGNCRSDHATEVGGSEDAGREGGSDGVLDRRQEGRRRGDKEEGGTKCVGAVCKSFGVGYPLESDRAWAGRVVGDVLRSVVLSEVGGVDGLSEEGVRGVPGRGVAGEVTAFKGRLTSEKPGILFNCETAAELRVLKEERKGGVTETVE